MYKIVLTPFLVRLGVSPGWAGCNRCNHGDGKHNWDPHSRPAFGYLRELSNWLLINLLPAETERKGL